MQKVTLTIKTPVATIENGKPVVKFEERTATHIVASTKSYNTLIEDYQSKATLITATKREDLFLNRDDTERALDEIAAKLVSSPENAELVATYLKNVLDGACVYFKPIIRKK